MLLKCILRNVKLNISFVYISHSNVLEREINKNVLYKLNYKIHHLVSSIYKYRIARYNLG